MEVNQDATYIGLDVADIHLVHDLAGLVRVANILERLGGITASLVQQDLLTTGVLIVNREKKRC